MTSLNKFDFRTFESLHQKVRQLESTLGSLADLSLVQGDKIGYSEKVFYVSGQTFKNMMNESEKSSGFKKGLLKPFKFCSRKLSGDRFQKVKTGFQEVVRDFKQAAKELNDYFSQRAFTEQELALWEQHASKLSENFEKTKTVFKVLKTSTYLSREDAKKEIGDFERELQTIIQGVSLKIQEKKELLQVKVAPKLTITPYEQPLTDRTVTVVSSKNVNMSKDVALRELSTVHAAKLCLGYFTRDLQRVGKESLIKRANQVVQSTLVKMEQERGIKEEKHSKTPEKASWYMGFAIQWKKATTFEKQMTTEVMKTLKALHQILQEGQGNLSIQGKRVLQEYTALFSDEKMLSKEFSIFIPSAHAHLRKDQQVLLADFKVGNRVFHEKVERVNAGRVLYGQDLLRVENIQDQEERKILNDLILRIPAGKRQEWIQNLQLPKEEKKLILFNFLIHEAVGGEKSLKVFKAIQKHAFTLAEALDHKEKTEQNAFRSSMEAKRTELRDPYRKGHMVSNPWLETISTDGKEPMRVLRSGGFTDFSDTKTNVRDMQRQLNQATDQEKLELEKKLTERKLVILDKASTIVVEQALLAGQQIEKDLKTGKSNISFWSKELHCTQVSLVHPKKETNEAHMVLDMQWGLTQFEGKDIVYDGKSGLGPDGKLHVPMKILDESGKALQLKARPTLWNITVKGNGKSLPIQDEINLKALGSLKKRMDLYRKWVVQKSGWPREQIGRFLQSFDLKWKSITDKLVKKESHFDFAEEVADLEQLISYIAVNCKSGKDRTGILLNRLIRRYLRKYTPEEVKVSDVQLLNQVMNRSASLYITGINTFVKAFKLAPKQMTGLGTGEKTKMLAYSVLVFS